MLPRLFLSDANPLTNAAQEATAWLQKLYPHADPAEVSGIVEDSARAASGSNVRNAPAYFRTTVKREMQRRFGIERFVPFRDHAVEPDLETAILLRECLESLRVLERQILILRCEGYTHAEIGERLGYQPDAIRQMASRALRKLKMRYRTHG